MTQRGTVVSPEKTTLVLTICARFSEKEAEVSPKKEESSARHARTKGYSHLYTHCPSQTVLYADMQVAIKEHIKDLASGFMLDVQSRKHNCT